MQISRRNLIALSTASIATLAGCGNFGGGSGTGPDDIEQQETRRQRVCTEAYVTNFNWDGQWFNEDTFEGTVVNQGDVAGTVTVELRFWESEATNSLQGSVERSVSVGAQDTRDISVSAHPPTDQTEWATMRVSEQDCEFQ